MKCPTPIWIAETEKTSGTYVPCGRCYACLTTRRNVWTFRILQELKVAESARFVTLTYTDETVPYILQYGRQMVMELKKKIFKTSLSY